MRHQQEQLPITNYQLPITNRQKLPLAIFIGSCINLIIAPVVYAAANGIERGNAYAIGVLYLLTLGLAIYLFIVVFQPERF